MYEYVNICEVKGRTNTWLITSKSDFFKVGEELIFEITGDSISFKKPSLDYRGKGIRVNNAPSGWKQMTVVTTDAKALPIGKFFFDDESNEDQAVSYYSDHRNLIPNE